ncbi:homeobox protein Hox-C4a-like [Vespula maculifrons]|uniref:Homeobox protein Hox-C4a-like n=1 Tax=Vespula maculifrons TaxID=7453 RepID=A0ABD2ALF9_VESMC
MDFWINYKDQQSKKNEKDAVQEITFCGRAEIRRMKAKKESQMITDPTNKTMLNNSISPTRSVSSIRIASHVNSVSNPTHPVLSVSRTTVSNYERTTAQQYGQQINNIINKFINNIIRITIISIINNIINSGINNIRQQALMQ